jgi:aminomethyltransferase
VNKEEKTAVPPLPRHEPADPERLAAVLATGRELIEVRGADRVRFLNGYVTCDVKALAAGRGSYGFFTTAQGKIMADAVVLALEDRLLIEVPSGLGSRLIDHLTKYVIADRVEVRDSWAKCKLWVTGSAAASALSLTEGREGREGHEGREDAWRVVKRASPWGSLLIFREGRLGVPGWGVWGEEPAIVAVEHDLAARGAGVLGLDQLEIARVERGLARFLVDFDEGHFPQETGAEAEAVSYTKGCYLGQEIVARIHYRGQPQHALRGLVFETLPQAGVAILDEEGRAAGRATSVADSPSCGPIGLAVLHRRACEADRILNVEGGGEVQVVHLPFEVPPGLA